MIQIFGAIPNVDIYFDDLIISGDDEVEHDKALAEVMNVASRFNVKFNSSKLQYKVGSVSFMGHFISKDDIAPDEKHIRAISKLESPKNKKELMRVLGIFKFLGKFISNLSQKTACLRELTKDKVVFKWEELHENCFQCS